MFIIFVVQKAKVVATGTGADPFDNHSCVKSSPCLVSAYPAAVCAARARGFGGGGNGRSCSGASALAGSGLIHAPIRLRGGEGEI